ncbi:MAG: hypothetical protein LQ340_007699 [Diploschistes diacapsis]|nr:MAG: hypothetical protein LQ340_007699 [Diploschistes diacapsis]
MSYSYVYKSKNEQWRHHRNASKSFDATVIASTSTALVYLILLAGGAYYLLRRSNVLPPNALQRFLWRCFVYSVPPSLVLALERRALTRMEGADNQENYANSRTFGAKSEAVRKILGFESSVYLDGFRSPGSFMRMNGGNFGAENAALPGLFNRDNECYQNSVIQGLAALPSFSDFVNGLPSSHTEGEHTALREVLQNVLGQLNDPDHYGKAFWTPYALKSMSSWQQQDAQEYYSKVIDELEKDAAKSLQKGFEDNDSLGLGSLRSVVKRKEAIGGANTPYGRDAPSDSSKTISEGKFHVPIGLLSSVQNPLEGLLAQRVGCLRCGFVEGLSLIPFNCLTVSLGRVRYTDIKTCLDTYTDLETISGVECARCTLQRQEKMFVRMLEASSGREEDPTRKAYYELAETRLQAVKAALENHDFSESTLAKKCKIPSKSRVSTNKTRQAVIARAPKALAIHVNRSVFDETTGAQFKNFAGVQFPKHLNLDPWCLGGTGAAGTGTEEAEEWELDPSKSMLARAETDDTSNDVSQFSGPGSSAQGPSSIYTLRAVITHYGTHGDGHYIAYRQSLQSIAEKDPTTWWRLSDEEVVQVDEDTVLNQGGVFMLFYERVDENSAAPTNAAEPSAALERVPASPTACESDQSHKLAVESENKSYAETAEPISASPQQSPDKPSQHPPTAVTKQGSHQEPIQQDEDSNKPQNEPQVQVPAPEPTDQPYNNMPLLATPPGQDNGNPQRLPHTHQMRTASEVNKLDAGVDHSGLRGMVPAV